MRSGTRFRMAVSPSGHVDQPSKLKSQAELQLSGRGAGSESRDLTGIGVANRDAGRHIPILHIQRIERFKAELHVPAFFRQWETLEHRDVHVEHRGPTKNVASEIPERA